MDTFIDKIKNEIYDLLRSIDEIVVDDQNVNIYLKIRRRIYRDVDALLGEIVEAVCGDVEAVCGDVADDVVSVLLDEIVGVVCEEAAEEVIIKEDDETPAEGKAREAEDTDEIDTEEAPTAEEDRFTPAPRGRARRLMAATWKGVRRVTRLMSCGCFGGR
ncbi:unnamed protein product [Macrosiphum euphorbiae]|uniref:Uncharacterized protein n=1 Tax=Macrosiphum euphorbiae TaxID=13131 RepID=A0AAV0XIM8_9HEMI|nr:unnamed protein product [Macrosiphum euphorbiae]